MTTRAWTLIRAMALVPAVLAMAACGAVGPTPTTPAMATPPTPATPAASAAPASSPAHVSRRPIIITTDLAGDDLMAVMAMLREPAVDVRAIAVDGNGEVHCSEGLLNMRRLLGAFGRTDIPIGCGREVPGPNGRLFPDEWRTGADAFYGVELPPVAGTSLGTDAARLISEAVAASAEPLTIVALGPWTSIADAFAADPGLAGRVAGIHAMAGAIDVPGNISVEGVTPKDGVEWNVGVDPDAFAAVLATDVPVTLVPLDATDDVPVSPDFASVLERDHAAAGADIAFEMFARSPYLATDTSFWDTLAVMALVDPLLVTWEDLAARVEPTGPSAGRIVRDATGRPVRAAMAADASAFMTAFLAALRRGDPRPEPFTVTGSLAVRWDGSTCRIEGAPPMTAGLVKVDLTNDSGAPVGLLGAGVKAPKTWSDALAFIEAADFSDPKLGIPDWIIQVPGAVLAEAGKQTTAFVTLPAAEVGVLCGTGEWPKLEFFDAGSFLVGD